MPIRLASIVIDCHDPRKLAEFWEPAIGYKISGDFNQYVVLIDPAEKGPNLILQGVTELRSGKNRMHWDWMTENEDEYQAEVARLEGLGATITGEVREMGIKWTVMHDPEGNEFCVAVH